MLRTRVAARRLRWAHNNPAALAAVTLQPRRHASVVRHNTVEDYVTSRFGCGAEEAAKFEKGNSGRASSVDRATDSCDKLQQRLDLSEAELKKIVLKTPSALHFSYEANIEPKLALLQRRLDLSEAELKKIVLGHSPLLGYGYDTNIEPSLAALQRRLDLSEMELKKIVLGLPSVLSYSYEKNLEPKLAFLQEELQFSKEMLRETIVNNPSLLGYSLEKRYRPRVEQCREADEPVQLVVERSSLTNEKFEKLLARRRLEKRNDARQRQRSEAVSGDVHRGDAVPVGR